MSYIARGTTSNGIFLKPPGSRQLNIALTATANGTTTTFIDTTRLTNFYFDTLWVGATITFTSGALPPTGNNGVSKVCTVYTGSTRTVTWVGALDVATAIGDTATISYGPRPGPSKVRLYSASIAANISAATTGAQITITDLAVSQTTFSNWFFQTPATTNDRMGFTATYGPRGVVLTDAPMGIIVVPAFSGAGGSAISTDIVYDFEPGELTDDNLGMGIGDPRAASLNPGT